MPKISTYKTVIPQGDDKIIISQPEGTPSNVTKNITVDGLKNYINAEGIPTPYMYALKRPGTVTTSSSAFIAMQKPTETEWLSKNPRLFMYRYKKTKLQSVDGNYAMKRKDFVHPTHQNGSYIDTNFPGSNWGSAIQTAEYQGFYLSPLFPITTEWDINTELKIAKTESLITDFASLRPTTYIEVPFNPLQFLYDVTNTEVTSLPAVALNGDPWGTRLTINPPNNNQAPDNNSQDRRTSKIIMKFVIGIPNPTWTNTNHELPYIFGNFSNAMMLKYQYDGVNRSIISAYTITQGATGPAPRGVF